MLPNDLRGTRERGEAATCNSSIPYQHSRFKHHWLSSLLLLDLRKLKRPKHPAPMRETQMDFQVSA